MGKARATIPARSAPANCLVVAFLQPRHELGWDLPSVEESYAVFGDGFLRAVAVAEAPSGSLSRHTNYLNEPESEA
jgi:hypothetical protein